MATIETLSIQFNANGTSRAVENIRNMGAAVRELGDALKSVEGASINEFASALGTLKGNIPTSTQSANMQTFAAAITEFVGAVSGASITQVANDMSNLSNAVQGMGARSARTLTNAAEAMHNFAEETREAVENANVVQPNTQQPQANQAQPIVQEANEMIAALDRVQVRANGLRGILNNLGINVPTRQFRNLERNAERVRERYNELREAMIQALNGGELTAGTDAFRRREAELNALRRRYEDLIELQRELSQEGRAFRLNPNIARTYQAIGTAAKGVKNIFSGISTAVQTTNKAINGFIGKIRGISSASKKAKTDTKSFKETIKGLAKEVTRLSKMLKLMITRMALRAVIKEVGNGFKSLALHSQEFDQNMSNLINSSKTLGYSISGMAGQLINALAPALLYLIQLITRVVNALNQLFSALRNKSTWSKAKDFTGSWSDSIESANKKAKELKKTVLGFDELNQLTDKTTSGGDTSGNITDMFEDVPIEPWIKDLSSTIATYAEKLFEPIKAAWEKVGGWVKEKWKYALEELVKLGSSVARDFWKVWEQPQTEQIFKNILIIIGEIGRTVGNLAKRFREAWDENETGYKILVAIRDIILTVTEKIRDMATATADWADSLNFSPLLESVQRFLESLKPVVDAVLGIISDFYNEVVLKFTKWVIESGLPKLIDVFTDFNNKVDWEGLRSKLKTLWQHLEPFMETVGEGLIIFIQRVTDKIAKFVNGEKFQKFLDDLEKWMDRVTPEQVADKIEQLVTALIALKIAAVAVSLVSGAATVISAIVGACRGAAQVVAGIAALASGIATLAAAAGELDRFINNSTLLKDVLITLGGAISGNQEKAKELKEAYAGTDGTLRLFKNGIQTGWYAITGQTEKLEELSNQTHTLTDANGHATKQVDIFGNTILDLTPRIGDMTKKTENAVTNVKELSGQVKTTTDVLPKLSENTTKAASANESISKAVNAYRESLNNADTAQNTYKANIEVVRQVQEKSKKMTDETNSSFKTFKDTTGQVTLVLKDNKPAFEKAGEAAKSAKDNVDKYMSTSKDNIKVINDNTIKLKDNQPAYVKAGEAAKEAAKELKSYESSTEDVIKVIPQMTREASDVTKSMDGITSSVTDATKTIQDSMSEDKWTFSGVASGLEKTFGKAKEAIGRVWNSLAEKLNGSHKVADGEINIDLPKVYANGGFPEDGLFFANHNELVGTFSNGKTAVANNAMIVEGIQSGVYSAVSRAMANNSTGSSYISNEIIVDGEVIARSITKAQEKRNIRYSPQTV